MFNFLLKLFIVFIVFHLNNVHASLSHFEPDLELSKRYPLISGKTYSNIFKENAGVVTLCFNNNEHAALVFEVRLPNDPENIALKLIHFGAPREDCCASGPQTVLIEDEITTLKKVYRAQRTLLSTGKTRFEKPIYTRYASFIVKNSALVEALQIVEKDQERRIDFSYAGTKIFKDSHNCNSYVAKILNEIGVKIHFKECWRQNMKTLKELIDRYRTNYQVTVIKSKELPKFFYDTSQ